MARGDEVNIDIGILTDGWMLPCSLSIFKEQAGRIRFTDQISKPQKRWKLFVLPSETLR